MDQLNVGIVGAGWIAEKAAITLNRLKEVSCYAIASRSLEKAQDFASKWGVPHAYGSYSELLDNANVDLVYVATPHSEHFDNVKLAISAGKHVLCEKAFMLNEQQAKTIFKFAEEKNVLVTEAMWTRYMPMRQKLLEILASGVIGEPTMLTANLGYNISGKERINKPELGGGALLDLGVYVLNFASMVFGDDVTDIVSMCSFNEYRMDLHDSITLRYRNGKMAVLNASALSISDRNGVIYGSKGYIIVENINNFEGIAVYDSDHRKVAYYKRPKQKTGYEYEVEACVKAIGEGWLECPEMPHSETLKMLNMMDFIRQSNNIVFPCETSFEAENATEEAAIEATSEETTVEETTMEESASEETAVEVAKESVSETE